MRGITFHHHTPIWVSKAVSEEVENYNLFSFVKGYFTNKQVSDLNSVKKLYIPFRNEPIFRRQPILEKRNLLDLDIACPRRPMIS
jgi:hypothetical protein